MSAPHSMSGHFLNDLRASFEKHRSRRALIYGRRTWTYGELNVASGRCAAWLQSQGIRVGDRVAFFTPNKLPLLIRHLGVLFAGSVPLPLNSRLTGEEMRYFLGDSRARAGVAGIEQPPLI